MCYGHHINIVPSYINVGVTKPQLAVEHVHGVYRAKSPPKTALQELHINTQGVTCCKTQNNNLI